MISNKSEMQTATKTGKLIPSVYPCKIITFDVIIYSFVHHFMRVTLIATLAILSGGPLKNIYTNVHILWKKHIKFI